MTNWGRVSNHILWIRCANYIKLNQVIYHLHFGRKFAKKQPFHISDHWPAWLGFRGIACQHQLVRIKSRARRRGENSWQNSLEEKKFGKDFCHRNHPKDMSCSSLLQVLDLFLCQCSMDSEFGIIIGDVSLWTRARQSNVQSRRAFV